jgi:hypothetical protein
MTPFQSACVVIFGILAYLIWVDENIAVYFSLTFKVIKINTERMLWMIRLHPYNPITNLMIKWKYERLAREIQAEMECKATELNNAGKIVE